MTFSKLSFRSSALAVLCILLVAVPAMAALEGYIIVKGKRSHVVEVQQSTASPRDSQTGLATGKRLHKPLTIVKEVDASSPVFRKALNSHETLGTVVIEFTHQGQSPEKLTLNDAVITRIQSMSHRGVKSAHEQEEITFTYQKIEWTFAGGKKTATDDWTQK